MKPVLSLCLFFFLQTIAFAQPITGTDVYLYEDADVKPHFEGGDTEFTRFLDLLAYRMPKGCDNTSSLSFSFMVEKDGSISEAGTQLFTDSICADFIVKQILAMHKWTPGMENGKPIRVLCSGEIRFREDDEQEPILIGEISDSDMINAPPPPPPPPPPGDYTDEPVAPPDLLYSDTTVFMIVESFPQFPGGEVELLKYIRNSIKHPGGTGESAGTLIVNFIVEKDGNISNVKIVRAMPGPDGNIFDAEALRIVKSMPKWKPGMQNGKPVRVSYNLPIRFEPQR